MSPDGKNDCRCSANWSLRLLADKAVELEIVESISYETVRRTLKKTNGWTAGTVDPRLR